MRATKKAANDTITDLGRQTPSANGSVDSTPSLASLAIRVRATLSRRVRVPVARADRALVRLERRSQRREQLLERISQHRFTARIHHRLVQISDHDRRSTLLGDLTAFVPAFIALSLIVVMAVNDPGVVYLALRGALDVPASKGTFEVSDPAVAIALAGAVGVTLTVVAAVLWGAHSITALLYWGRLQRGGRYPEVEESATQVGMPQLVAKTVAALVVLGAVMTLLHFFATARFGGVLNELASVDGSSADAGKAVIWQVTLLPLVLLLVEIVNLSPPMKHRRDIARWGRTLRVLERLDVRADHRSGRRVNRRRRVAEQRIERVQDVSNLGVLAGDTEIARAALTHGGLDTSALTPLLTITDTWGAAAPADTPSVALTGLPVQGLTALRAPAGSVRAARLAERLAAVTVVPDESVIATRWRQAREAAIAETGLTTRPGDPLGGDHTDRDQLSIF